MKNTGLADFEHYHDAQAFTRVEEGIYQALADMGSISAGDYVLALCFELENDEENADCHYLLEDILDSYNAFAPYADVQGTEFVVEFAISNDLHPPHLSGAEADESLAQIRALKTDLLNARVTHRTVDRDDGQYLELSIEK